MEVTNITHLNFNQTAGGKLRHSKGRCQVLTWRNNSWTKKDTISDSAPSILIFLSFLLCMSTVLKYNVVSPKANVRSPGGEMDEFVFFFK